MTELEWFAGDQQALNLYHCFVDVAHTWDDLRDKDKPVSNYELDRAFYVALYSIPFNPVFIRYSSQLQPLLLTSIMGYRLANKYEDNKDEHGLEIAHTMRYAVAQVFTFLITMLNGPDKAVTILDEAMKIMVNERITPYIEEHLK